MADASTVRAMFDAFDAIEATTKKTEKLEKLKSLCGTPAEPLVKQYLGYAMDWFMIFGIGEKTLEAAAEEDDLDAAVFGSAPKREVEDVPAHESWNAAVRLVSGLLGDPSFEKPNKADIVNFVRSITDAQAKRWIVAMLLKKPRMGVSEKTVNSVWPNLIRYFEVQLADVLEEPKALFKDTFPLPEKWTKTLLAKRDALPDHYWLEPKLDGIRAVCIVRVEERRVSFFSRGGQVLNNTAPAGIDDLLLKTCREDVVFDGELFCENWNETTKVTSKGEGEADPALVAKLRFYVFDMLTLAEWESQRCDRTYADRRDAIPYEVMGHADDRVVRTASHAVENAAQIDALFQKYLKKGFEGVMVKHPKGRYEFKRSTAWLKYKPLMTDEFEVVGKYEGQAHSKNAGKLGGLVVKVADGVTCEVGSGFSDAQREEFWASPPIGKLIEVEFKEYTPDGKLREGVFVRVRDDKRPE